MTSPTLNPFSQHLYVALPLQSLHTPYTLCITMTLVVAISSSSQAAIIEQHGISSPSPINPTPIPWRSDRLCMSDGRHH